MEDEYVTPLPLYITFAVVFVFLLTVCAFLGFNWVVEHRQALVLRQAVRSTAIVSSLFPDNVRDRLIHGDDEEQATSRISGKYKIRSFLDKGDEGHSPNKPIADLFTDCTGKNRNMQPSECLGSLTEAHKLLLIVSFFFNSSVCG